MASETMNNATNGFATDADGDGREQVEVGEVTDANDVIALRAEIESLTQQAAESQDAFLRARADYQNLKRRSDEEKDNLKQFVTGELLVKLLPVVDNLERALTAAAQTNDYEKLVGGVNAVYRQLQTILDKEGLVPIPAVGETFDPNLHNAVLRDEESGLPDNTVVEELQKGYTLGDRVLRATMVKVAVGK